MTKKGLGLKHDEKSLRVPSVIFFHFSLEGVSLPLDHRPRCSTRLLLLTVLELLACLFFFLLGVSLPSSGPRLLYTRHGCSHNAGVHNMYLVHGFHVCMRCMREIS